MLFRIAFVIALCLAAAPHAGADMASAPEGVDVSHYQGDIDWKAVKGAGVDFVFIKVSEGVTFIDPRLEANWRGAKANAILRGGYHLFVPGDDGRAQAENFLTGLRGVSPNYAGHLPPVLDIEPIAKADMQGAYAHVSSWLSHVEAELGCKPVIYTSPASWDREFPREFTSYALWLADYSAEPTLPEGWKTWRFWQYSQSGKIQGVAEAIDLNRFNGSPDELKRMLCSGR